MTIKNELTLLYGYDPLCGWCYAFASQMMHIQAAFPTVKIEVLYGGLVLGERIRPISQDAAYLQNGEHQLHAVTGVQFGNAFKEGLLAAGDYVSNSEPPCRAVWCVQQLAPELAFANANALPHAYYWHGLPLDDVTVLSTLAKQVGVHEESFRALWLSEEAQRGVQTAFTTTRQRGITGYPTLLAAVEQTTMVVVRGWQSAEMIISQLNVFKASFST